MLDGIPDVNKQNMMALVNGYNAIRIQIYIQRTPLFHDLTLNNR